MGYDQENITATPRDFDPEECFKKIQSELSNIVNMLDNHFINSETVSHRTKSKAKLLKRSLEEAVYWLKLS